VQISYYSDYGITIDTESCGQFFEIVALLLPSDEKVNPSE